ncbi:hypothetical protein HYX13_00645 [Candidatus Woesearchaeota archaeon]|nr:hypothetical protein [Candidatus Woesearchaeota archaeon]
MSTGIEKSIIKILRIANRFPTVTLDPETAQRREINREYIDSLAGDLVTLRTPQGEYQGVFVRVVSEAHFYRHHGKGTVRLWYYLEDLEKERTLTKDQNVQRRPYRSFSTEVSAVCHPCEGLEDVLARLRLYKAEIKEKFR